MTFLDSALFPTAIDYGSSGGPSFANIIQRTPAGRVSILQRNADPVSRWSVRWRRDPEASGAILSFLRVTHGALHGFRFLDFNDFSTTPDHVGAWDSSTSSHRHLIGTGDGSTTRFPLSKTYSSSGSTRSRRIRKPMRLSEAQSASNLHLISGLTAESEMHAVWQAGALKTIGVHYSIDYEAGEIVFVTAPSGAETIEWAGYFVVPCRFGPATDEKVSLISSNYSEREFDEIEVEEIVESTTQIIPERFPGGSSFLTELSSATQRVLGFADGEFVRIDADAVSPSPFPVKLPVLATWMLGGPIVSIVNEGSSKSIDVQDSTGASLATLTAGDWVEMWVGMNSAGTAPEWRPL